MTEAASAPGVRRIRVPRRALIALLVLVAVGAAAAIALATGVFSSSGRNAGTGIDNAFPTAVGRIEERSLSSQTQVSATLGYADPATIVVPPGTAPSSVQQAQQAVTTSQGQLTTAQATLAADSDSVAQLGAELAAARGKETIDCRGANAAEAASSGGGTSGGAGAGPCASDVESVTSTQASLSQATAKVTTDRAQVTSATQSLAAAQSGLTSAQSSGAVYGQGATFTTLPAVGAIVHRGGSLFGVSGEPVVLLYGAVAPWRAFVAGMTPGADVRELNANLQGLGYGHELGGAEFTAATAAAIDRFQTAHGMTATGQLLLGSVVFEPDAVRVTAVTPTPGAAVQAGPVLSVTSMVRQVTIALDASEQTSVAVGDAVTITLPDNSTTPGRVTYVGSVATTPAADQSNGGGGSPTIEVDVTPLRPAATGRLDQAPVNVSITTARVKHALVVPVDALLALASGGYAVEEIGAGGAHQLVAVELGLFDDADGYVQVTGSGIAAGQRVVIPAE